MQKPLSLALPAFLLMMPFASSSAWAQFAGIADDGGMMPGITGPAGTGPSGTEAGITTGLECLYMGNIAYHYDPSDGQMVTAYDCPSYAGPAGPAGGGGVGFGGGNADSSNPTFNPNANGMPAGSPPGTVSPGYANSGNSLISIEHQNPSPYESWQRSQEYQQQFSGRN